MDQIRTHVRSREAVEAMIQADVDAIFSHKVVERLGAHTIEAVVAPSESTDRNLGRLAMRLSASGRIDVSF